MLCEEQVGDGLHHLPAGMTDRGLSSSTEYFELCFTNDFLLYTKYKSLKNDSEQQLTQKYGLLDSRIPELPYTSAQPYSGGEQV